MPSTSITPANDSQVDDELLNLANAIAQYAELQRVRGHVRVGLGFVATYTLFAPVPIKAEDYSDLSSKPPEDATSWRGALFRQLRNAATADGEDSPVSGRAGHGRGAPK